MKLPALKREWLCVIQDTREQLPWTADELGMEVAEGTLDSGDYSIDRMAHIVRVERKSLDDFVNCCGSSRERFERELVRLRGFPHHLIIIEASAGEIDMGQWRSKVTPRQIRASILAWQRDGNHVHLAGDRKRAAADAADFLFLCARKRWQEFRPMVSLATQEVAAC